MRDLSPSDVIKPEVRGLTAYTLKHFDADVKLDQNENPYELPADLKRRGRRSRAAPPVGPLPGVRAGVDHQDAGEIYRMA